MLVLLSFYFGLLFLALLVEPLARRLRLPFSLVLVVLGYIASEVFTGLGGDTGLHWALFHDLVFFVFLPVLIFEAAFTIDVRQLLRNLPLILVLAIPVMLLSALVTAAILYLGIGHPTGFPWIAALLAAALLSATDPVAVLDLFKRAGAPERLRTLIDGESLFNDAAAIVLFTLLVAVATGQASGQVDAWGALLAFARTFFGGAAAGALAGGLALALMAWLKDRTARSVLSLVVAYGAFLVAEGLHVSGVMAVLVAGLMAGAAARRSEQGALYEAQHQLWAYKAWLANTLLFLISGISFQLAMFTDQWLAILIGIGATLVARAVGVFAALPLMGLVPGLQPVPRPWQPVIWWGGIRGAVTLALALSLPPSLEYWWTIQSIAYGVVLWSLLVQAGTMNVLLRRSGIGS